MNPVDFPSDWPLWVVILFLALNLFKDQIGTVLGSFVPVAIREHFSHLAKREADKEEHEQEIEEVQLNARLQASAAEQLRKSWREENLMQIVQSKDEWERELFRDLTKLFNQQAEQLQNILRAQIRTNDLLTTLNITMTRTVTLLEQNGNGHGRGNTVDKT